MGKRVLAALASVALVSVLGCCMAFAQEPDALQSASVITQTKANSSQLSATAKKTIYVVKSIGGEKITYNENGLVAKRTSSYETREYTYSGAKVESISITRNASSPVKWYLQYDGKNRLKKLTSSGASTYDMYTDVYSYNKKGRVSKIVRSETQFGNTTTYKYTSKGYVKSSLSTNGTKCIYGYDKHNNVSAFSMGPASGSGMTRFVENRYTYKNGRIKQRSQTMNGTGGTATVSKYTYKKVSVPKKYVAQVKKQQRVLVGNPNPSLPL